MKIAIVGTGISGLSAAYLLAPHHDITVYEKNPTIGGHSRTINITIDDKPIPVDTGFIVFNQSNYPYLCSLFNHLQVPIEKSDMSFGASISNGWLEYSSKGLFGQKRNLFRPRFWGMIKDILYFNKVALRYIDADPSITLRYLLTYLDMGEWFSRYYLQAMGAAIWSCSTDNILDFPASTFIRFFKNHGLLTVNDQPQWYTVSGGSIEYITRLTASFKDRIRTNCGAEQVMRTTEGITIKDSQGVVEHYDHVIMACHANQALAILDNSTTDENVILGAFGYQDNYIVVHSDTSFMPKQRESWASWIYLTEEKRDESPTVSLSYWMNNLQNLPVKKQVFVTLNPSRMPDPETIYDTHSFSHPIFDSVAIWAQNRLHAIQGKNNTWFCGAYQSYGFHEDGLASAVRVAESFGIKPPWN